MGRSETAIQRRFNVIREDVIREGGEAVADWGDGHRTCNDNDRTAVGSTSIFLIPGRNKHTKSQ